MAIEIIYPDSFPKLAEDTIEVSSEPGGDPNNIEFCLMLTNKVTNWKGIVLGYPNIGAYRTIADLITLQDTPQCGVVTPADLAPSTNPTHLYLSKAKMFNIHTDMYWITNANTAFVKGQRYIFKWTKE